MFASGWWPAFARWGSFPTRSLYCVSKACFLSDYMLFLTFWVCLTRPASRSRHLPPKHAFFNAFLEHNKALKRHRDGVFHTKFLQTLHHRVAEKSTVHADLHSRRWDA